MTAGQRLSFRTIGLWALLAPFLLLSLISPAVMPVRDADGTLTLVLCSGDGPVEMVIDLATGEPVDRPQPGAQDRCDWACGQMEVIALLRPEASPPPLVVRRADPPAATVLLARARITGLPPATGPPAVV